MRKKQYRGDSGASRVPSPIVAATAGVTLMTMLGGAVLSTTTQAAPPTAKPAARPAAKAAKVVKAGRRNLIVQLASGSKRDTAGLEVALSKLGGYVYRHLGVIDAVAVSLPAHIDQSRVAALPGVRHLSPDLAVHKTDEFTVENSGADIAYTQNNLTGYGVNVAVIDSGIRPSQDLTDNVAGGTRVLASVDLVSSATGTNDMCGHGTHVAGILGGNGAASTGSSYYRTFYGVARRVGLVNVRVLNDKGQGTVSDVIAGINWVVTNKTKYKIRIINLSLGHPVGESYKTDPLCQAVERAWKAGIVVVVAAGNDGRLQDTQDSSLDNEGYGTNYGSILSPGNDPYVITVGAMKVGGGDRSSDRIATYSSRGPSRLDFVMKPDIVAPGNRVISTNANNSYLDNAYGGTNQINLSDYSTQVTARDTTPKYFRLSGTSMAAPVVSGAAALLLQKYPTLTPDTVKARLMISADRWGYGDEPVNPCTFGAGYLDIPAALASTVTVSGMYAISPALGTDEYGNVYVDPQRALWGKSIWETGITDLRAIWGKSAIWGSSTNIMDASRAIWGKSVWADRAMWGSSQNNADLSSRAIHGEN